MFLSFGGVSRARLRRKRNTPRAMAATATTLPTVAPIVTATGMWLPPVPVGPPLVALEMELLEGVEGVRMPWGSLYRVRISQRSLVFLA